MTESTSSTAMLSYRGPRLILVLCGLSFIVFSGCPSTDGRAERDESPTDAVEQTRGESGGSAAETSPPQAVADVASPGDDRAMEAGGKRAAGDPLTTEQLQAFHQACISGNRKRVEMMLDDHYDVNAIDDQHRTALMLASFDGHQDVCTLLLEHGADVNSRDASGRTALMYAASGPNLEAVRVLLKHGAEVNITDSGEHWTALMFAAAEGHADEVALLMQYKADPRLKDVDGETAHDFARANGHTSVLAALTSGPQPPSSAAAAPSK